MKRILLCCGFILLSFYESASCAPVEGIPPLPNGPLLRKMADTSAVQINYSYTTDQANPASGAAATPPPAPTLFPTSPIRQMTLTRTRALWHAVRLDVYGNIVEEWCNGSDYFYSAPGIPPILNNPPVNFTDPTALPDFNRFDFPDMELVSAKNYSGVEVVQGHSCLIFKKDDQTAWIDSETRFPIQWQQGAEKRIFQQLPPPTQMITFPPQVARLAATMKHDRDKWSNLVVPSNKK